MMLCRSTCGCLLSTTAARGRLLRSAACGQQARWTRRQSTAPSNQHDGLALRTTRTLHSGRSSSGQREQGPSTSRLLDLPRKAEIEIGHKGRLAGIVPPKRCRQVTHRVGSKFGGSHSLRWIDRPRTIFLVKKTNDEETSEAMSLAIRHLRSKYPGLTLVTEAEAIGDLDDDVQSSVLAIHKDDRCHLAESVDLCVTFGGDGTVLHVASLFATGAVPPILGVSMGTLGFLMPFTLHEFEEAFSDVMQDKASLQLRMRLKCAIHDKDGKLLEDFHESGSQALNEVHLHRGRHPHLTLIDTFVDGQYLTEAIADGLIVSTPTGSTAYSLSAGGPIVHPSVASLLLTPICPRSLSFRSVLLPTDVCIQLRISPDSRAPAELSLDGRSVRLLYPSEYLSVSMSEYPVPCVVPSIKPNRVEVPLPLLESLDAPTPPASAATTTPTTMTTTTKKQRDEVLDGGWVHDINQMLNFNKAFVTKGMLKHVTDD